MGMNESAQYAAYKKKLQGICDENDLVFRLRMDVYPIRMIIQPIHGLEEQMSMLEAAEEKDFISPDAKLVFYLENGSVTYKTFSNFVIGETLFNKLKKLFKNLYTCWLQYFFRDLILNTRLERWQMPVIEDGVEDSLMDEAEPVESYEDEEPEEDEDEAPEAE